MNIIEVDIELIEGLSAHETNSFWDKFLSQAIEANSLQFGGLNHGYIEPDGTFDLDNMHKQKVVTWLDKQECVNNYELRFVNDEEFEVEQFPMRCDD